MSSPTFPAGAAAAAPQITVVWPNLGTVTETFIKAHVDRLPAAMDVLWGGWRPRFSTSGSLLSTSIAARLWRAGELHVLGRPLQKIETRALVRRLRRTRSRLVLAEYGPTAVAVLPACRVAGVPLVAHFHGFDAYDRPTLEALGPDFRRMLEQAAAVVAVSRDMEHRLLGMGAPRESLFLNPYGVDLELFAASRPEDAPPALLAVGRMVEKKAPHLTILAFSRAAPRCPEATLTLVGDGPLQGACEQLVRALGLDGRVRLTGPRPPAEVAAMMRAARAFVQHSVTAPSGDSEGLPVAILEASASALPVIATRHRGIPDAVVDGVTGLLVDEFDVDGMADRMAAVCGDPRLAATLGRAGRQRAAERFSLEASIDGLWRILSRSLRAGARTP